MRYTGSNGEAVNSTVIRDGVVIEGTAFRLTNTEAGRIIGGLVFAQGGSVFVNQTGGIIRVADDKSEDQTDAITGSAGDDTVINAGRIGGRVTLGAGNDRFVDAGTSNSPYRIDLGTGNDSYEAAGRAGSLRVDGGEGRDRLILNTIDQSVVYGESATGFEDLSLSGNGQYFGFSGYSSITLGTPAEYGLSLISSANPGVDIALVGNSLRVNSSSLRSIIGSAAAERVEINQGTTISGIVAMGGGDDVLELYGFPGQSAPRLPVGGATGGIGQDQLRIQAFDGQTNSYDLSTVSAFEALYVNAGTMASGTVRVDRAADFTEISVGTSASLVLTRSALAGASLSGALGGTITLDAGSSVGRYGFFQPGFDQRTDIQDADDRLSTTFVNRGAVTGAMVFFIGDDLYDGTAGSVGGTVFGSGGNDVLLGGAGSETFMGGFGADRLDGGMGADVLSGDAGTDTLTGGAGADVFAGMRAMLAGDTVTDLSVGDRIRITDVAPGELTWSRIGGTLSLGNGASLTLTGGPNLALEVRAAAGGGSELVATHHETHANDFTGDGQGDLLWRNLNTGAFSTWGVDGNSFSPNLTYDGSVATNWKLTGTLDFNGDGVSDLLWREAGGSTTIWTGRGDGGFAPNAYGTFVTPDWKIAATGDFNGDGRDDLIWRNDNGVFTQWQSTGGGYTQNVYSDAGVPTDWKLAGATDFDGDGRDDLVWRNGTGGALSIWTSTGDAFAYDAYTNTSVDTSWQIQALADFDGDGRGDILWRNTNGVFTVWEAAGTGFRGNAYYDDSVSNDWQIVQAADMTGDGRADLAFRNVATGALTLWHADGDSGFLRNVGAINDVSTDWMLIGANGMAPLV